MTTGIVSGPQVLTQNTVYALPGRAKFVTSDKVLEVSNSTGSGFTLVAATTTGGALLGSAFVRSTTANANIFVVNE